jgi:hypothetical protein
MTDRLDDLLRALPDVRADHPLDQLEPAVWARIEAGRARGFMPMGSLKLQLMAAGMALVIGIALGWSMNSDRAAQDGQAATYASYVEVGPLARLERGL